MRPAHSQHSTIIVTEMLNRTTVTQSSKPNYVDIMYTTHKVTKHVIPNLLAKLFTVDLDVLCNHQNNCYIHPYTQAHIKPVGIKEHSDTVWHSDTNTNISRGLLSVQVIHMVRNNRC